MSPGPPDGAEAATLMHCLGSCVLVAVHGVTGGRMNPRIGRPIGSWTG